VSVNTFKPTGKYRTVDEQALRVPERKIYVPVCIQEEWRLRKYAVR
jgi:hypothetical protein